MDLKTKKQKIQIIAIMKHIGANELHASSQNSIPEATKNGFKIVVRCFMHNILESLLQLPIL